MGDGTFFPDERAIKNAAKCLNLSEKDVIKSFFKAIQGLRISAIEDKRFDLAGMEDIEICFCIWSIIQERKGKEAYYGN